MDEKEIELKLEKINELMMKEDLTSKEKNFVFEELTKILKATPNNIDALYWMALYYQGTKDYDTAISYYEKIIEINPNCPSAKDAKEMIRDCQEFYRDKKRIEYMNADESIKPIRYNFSKGFIFTVIFIIIVTFTIIFAFN